MNAVYVQCKTKIASFEDIYAPTYAPGIGEIGFPYYTMGWGFYVADPGTVVGPTPIPNQYGAVGNGADIMVIYVPPANIRDYRNFGVKPARIWPSWKMEPEAIGDYCTIIAL